MTFNVSANLVDAVDLDIVLTDDAFHELDEGFYLIATVNQLSVDSSNSMAERDGVALITIFNNDRMWLISAISFIVPSVFHLFRTRSEI